MAEAWDVFFSYRSLDWPCAEPLVTALRAAGLRVWIDREQIADLDDIQKRIEVGLTHARALVSWYSPEYASSRPCQWEFAAAFNVALNRRQALERIFVVNPLVTGEHIYCRAFRNQHWMSASQGEFETHAARIRTVVGGLTENFGALNGLSRPAPKLPGEPTRSLTSATYFVGRVRELWEIHHGLHAYQYPIVSTEPSTRSVTVFGMGGSGKSLLAEEYALRFASQYPGGVFWLNARGEREAQLAHIARELGIPVRDMPTDDVQAALRQKLADAGEPYLWIVDDPPPDAPDREVTRWRPRDDGLSHTLVTRNTRPPEGRGKVIELDRLSADAALQLLTRSTTPENDAEWQAASRICAEVGHQCQAIDVASAMLPLFPGRPRFAAYLEKLRNPRKDELEFAARQRGELPNGHEASIAATLLPAVQAQTEVGQQALRLAAQLARVPIPDELAVRVLADVRRVDPEEFVDDWREIIASLQRHALVRHAPDDSGFEVHALVSRTILYATAGSDDLRPLRDSAVRHLNNALRDAAKAASDAVVLAHARKLLTATFDTVDDAEMGDLIAKIEYRNGAYRSSKALWERVLDARRRLLGEDADATLSTMNNLGLNLSLLGQHGQARSLLERVVTELGGRLGDKDPRTLRTKSNLSATLHSAGETAAATAVLEEVIVVMRQELGEEDMDTLQALGNLTVIMNALDADPVRTRELQERVLAARQRLLGDDDPETLTALSNLGGTLYKQRDYAAARAAQEKVLATERRLLRAGHPGTWVQMNNLALTLSAQGDYAAARELQAEALARHRELFGDEDPRTLTVMRGLSDTLYELGDYAGCRELSERVLAISRRLGGDDHKADDD